VVSQTDTDKNEPDNPNAPESTAFMTASTSLVVVAVVAALKNKTEPKNEQGACFAEIIQRASTKRDG